MRKWLRYSVKCDWWSFPYCYEAEIITFSSVLWNAAIHWALLVYGLWSISDEPPNMAHGSVETTLCWSQVFHPESYRIQCPGRQFIQSERNLWVCLWVPPFIISVTSLKQIHFFLYSHFSHEMYKFFHTKQFSSSWQTLTGCPIT